MNGEGLAVFTIQSEVEKKSENFENPYGDYSL